MEPELARRYQSMLTLWGALLMSVFLYFLFTLFAGPPVSDEQHQRGGVLILVLTALGALLVIISLLVKSRILNQSIEKQDVGLVQKAMLIAIAMCEVSALLGVIQRFVVGGREYYLLFFFAAAGMLLHFPRRSQLEAARWSPLGSSTRPSYEDKES